MLRVQHQVQSRILQSHPWLQSCPGFPLSKHYTPEEGKEIYQNEHTFSEYILRFQITYGSYKSSSEIVNPRTLWWVNVEGAKMLYQLPQSLEQFN